MSRYFAFPHWVLVAGAGLILAVQLFPKALPTRTGGSGLERNCYAIDGDTLRCGRDRVRLNGIDAAELPGHCRRARHCAPGDPVAQKAVLAGIVQRPVKIYPIKSDHWGRTVATVVDARGENASCTLIAAGVRYVGKWDDRLETFRACPRIVARNGDADMVP